MRRLLDLLVVALLLAFASVVCGEGVRIKDIAMISGVRDNQLVGYGLVAGLAGDGDKNPLQTLQTIANILQRFGLTVPASTLSAKNVAIVIVTADIPAFKKSGTRLDVNVASMGDAKSLQGGILLQTPLLGADGKVYAVAQGALTLGGISAVADGAGGSSVVKNHPTVGQIANGALVEREIPAQIVSDHHLELILREPDFTTAARLALGLNQKFPDSSLALDSTTVRVRVPEEFEGTPVNFISLLEAIEITTDVPARIVINERTGTIVATSHIHISSCAVSHGNLTISITSALAVSQPDAFSQGGTTVVTPKTDTKVNEEKAAMIALPELPTVEKVASALNSLGVSPRDMMSMFQAMKEAGALQAELIIR
ncbi:MAG TPA: flagellar basal body P-ring protein FlgI [Candidatus Saccharimonadales bacterium]|nr:flagellar basal body P-ring protein FlgI [Candidatus Saccharimonadales bacterium]